MSTNHVAKCTIQRFSLDPGYVPAMPVGGTGDTPAAPTGPTMNAQLLVNSDPANTGIFTNAAGAVITLVIPNVPQPVTLIQGGDYVLTLAEPAAS